MYGVRGPRLQRRHPYQTMRGADDEIRGPDTIQLYGTAAQAQRVQREIEIDSRGPVFNDWEASARRYSFTLHNCETFCVSLTLQKTAMDLGLCPLKDRLH